MYLKKTFIALATSVCLLFSMAYIWSMSTPEEIRQDEDRQEQILKTKELEDARNEQKRIDRNLEERRFEQQRQEDKIQQRKLDNARWERNHAK